MIIIKTKKSKISNTVKGRYITDIKGCLVKDLVPIDYLKGYPHIYYEPEEHRIRINIAPNYIGFVHKDVLYTESQFQSSLLLIRKAGDRLHKINKQWQGEETFKI